MHQNFNGLFNDFCVTINGYDYYVDFDGVYKKVDDVVLNKALANLNPLLTSKNIEQDFVNIIMNNPSTLKCIPILLAVRNNSIPVYERAKNQVITYQFDINTNLLPAAQASAYSDFMKKTGLFDLLDLLKAHHISNLVDYVTGVEVGLDSNGRKNRSGKNMENFVEDLLSKGYNFLSLTNDAPSSCSYPAYHKQITPSEIRTLYGINYGKKFPDALENRRFDFAVKTANKLYVIETNFYSATGSKLGTIASDYDNRANQIQKDVPDVTFVWITDGSDGWRNARNALQNTYNNHPDLIYNLKDLVDDIAQNIAQKKPRQMFI